MGLCALILLLSGCSSPDVPVDTSQPLEGRALARESQLEGTWLGITEGDFIGFEFMDDGQVLATPISLGGLGSGQMFRYSVLEGGRLSLVTPNGQSQVFTAQLAGDQLELSGFMMLSETNSQRFRRLADGETLEQGMAQQRAAEAKAYEERLAGVNAFLARPGLVIAPTAPAPGAPAAIAVELAAGGTGKAWHDDASPHLDQITVQTSASDRAGTPQVNVTFGPQVQPPPTQARSGATIPFAVSGDVESPTLTALVNFGGQQFELQIARDPRRHEEIVDRFDAEIARIEALRAPLISALKDYAVLEGTGASENPNRPQANTVQIVLVREPTSGAYAGEATLIDGTTGQAQSIPQTVAQITVTGDKAMLVVNAANRQYQLTLDAATGKLGGGWFYQGNANGWQAELAVTQAIDAATRQQQVEAERSALASLQAATPLIGLVDGRVQFLPQPMAVSLALSSSGGQLSGTATFPVVRAVIDVQGQIAETLAGPRLQLRFTNLRESGHSHALNLFNTLRGQTWTYAVADAGAADAPVKLTNGAYALTEATDAYRREIREALTAALSGGLKMTITYPRYEATFVPLTFEFLIDRATGKVTGSPVSGAHRNLFTEKSTVDGELADLAGLPFLPVQITDPPPARANGFRRTDVVELAAYPTDDGWVFTGPLWPTHQTTARQYVGFSEAKD
jgi:hypothetical protein